MNEIDIGRLNEENGGANRSVQMVQDVCFLINDQDRCALYRLTDDGDEKIAPGPVEAFCLGSRYGRVFYQTEDRSLWTCRFDGGEKRRILGGNGDEIQFFTVNQDSVFIILKNQNQQTFLYQLSQDLQYSRVIQKTAPGQTLEEAAAGESKLYYILSGGGEQKTLMEYDFSTRREEMLATAPGLCRIQAYRGYLVMQRALTARPQRDQDWEMILMDPVSGRVRRLTLGETDQINCYWDHAFYIARRTGRIWAAPLAGGTPRLLWEQPADRLDLAAGSLFFINRRDGAHQNIPLDGEDRPWPFAETPADDWLGAPPEGKPFGGQEEEEPEEPPEQGETELFSRGKGRRIEEADLSKEAFQAIFKYEMDKLWKKRPGRTLLYNSCKLALILLWFWLCLPMLAGDFSGWTAVKAVGVLLAEWLGLIALETRLYTPEMERLERKYEKTGISMAYTPLGLRGLAFGAAVLAAGVVVLFARYSGGQIKGWLTPPDPEQSQTQQDQPEEADQRAPDAPPPEEGEP